jgi:hypothetical protein
LRAERAGWSRDSNLSKMDGSLAGGTMGLRDGTRRAYERVTRFVLGPLFVLGGLWCIAMAFASATLRDGDPDAPLSWRDYLGVVFSDGLSSICMGLIGIVGGIYLAATRSSSLDRTDGIGKRS